MSNSTVSDSPEWNFCLEDLPSRATTPLFVSLIISLTLCVIGNIAICLIVARHYQLHTVTNANIVNMAVGHLLFSIFCIPMYLSNILTHRQIPNALCSCFGFAFIFFATGSTFALILIALERYDVIVAKRSSTKIWTARTAKKSILGTWMVALVSAVLWVAINNQPRCISLPVRSSQTLIIYRLNRCLPFLNPPTNKWMQFLNVFLIVLCFLIPFIIVSVIYCRMVAPLWQGYNQVRPVGAGHPKTIRYTAEIRTARTMLLMFVLFSCCWAIYCYIAIVNALNRTSKQSYAEILAIISISLAFCSLSLDPIIYTLRNPRISMILRGRKNRKKRVKFNPSEFATDGVGVTEQTSKWIHGRCTVDSLETTTATTEKSDETRAASLVQTASSKMSSSVLSFSFYIGGEEKGFTSSHETFSRITKD